MSGVYSHFTKDEIKSTLDLLRYYRAFIRSDATHARRVFDSFGRTMTKEQAQRELTWLINVAINRKAGMPDEPYKKCSWDYQTRLWRDQRNLHEIINRRLSVMQFETSEVSRRYAHLLSDGDDYSYIVCLNRLRQFDYHRKWKWVVKYRLPGCENTYIERDGC
jgi:hypothetical protein